MPPDRAGGAPFAGSTKMSLISESKRAVAALTDEQEYRLLFAATFVMFLVAAVVVRIFRSSPSGYRLGASRMSLLAEARTMINSSLAFAFMG